MLNQETSDTGGGGGNNWARVCDKCRSAVCTMYCRADSAYLCVGCDARVHAANRVASRHERVWVCEAYDRAPATFLCKADAASLCATCDAEIHSANPLASRHQRVPILPISWCLYGPSATDRGGQEMASAAETEDGFIVATDGDQTIADEKDEDEVASWLLLNTGKKSTNQNNGFLFSGEVDDYLDLVEYNSSVENQLTNNYNQQQQHHGVQNKSYGGDSIAPVQFGEAKDHLRQQQQQRSFQYGMDYDTSKAAYSYSGFTSHSGSLSSVDVGVVPESTISSNSHTGPPIQMPPQLTAMDRGARVLRYRQKKKTRTFEKTIRYASRKEYAETRPRIKGRFAKRTDVEIEVDQMFSTTLMTETGYGIVPSF